MITIPGTPQSSRPQRPGLDDASARTGVAFAIVAAVGVGALVWALIFGPANASVDTSTHDRVELIRAATLRDLATPPASTYNRVELIRAATLRDLATRPANR